MARLPLALALLTLLTACTRSGTMTTTATKPGAMNQLLSKDWEGLCLQPSTPSCEPYLRRLPTAAIGECCRVKCKGGNAESCTAYLDHHAVTTPEFWNWPKVKELAWGERFGIVAPAELVEYLSVRTKRGCEAAADDPDFRKDLSIAWNALPKGDQIDGARLLIGVSAVKELGNPVEAVVVRQDGRPVAGVLALDWGTTLQPVNEWAKKPLQPTPRNHRRATLGWLLRIGIARLAGRPEPKP